MHARVTTVQVRPERLDELQRIVQEAVDALHQQPGFRGLTFMIERDTGKGLIQSLWDSEGALAATEGGIYRERMLAIGPLLAAGPIRDQYEVLVHDFS
jgi:quinol monooxygenase YgiN